MNNQKQSRGFYHAEPKLKLSELTGCLKTNLFFFKIRSFNASWRHLKKKKKKLIWNTLKILLWHYQNIPFNFFYPKLLVEFNLISFSQSSFFFRNFAVQIQGKNSLGSSQHRTPSWSLEGWHYDFKSSVCDNEELAMGNRPTAVCCQYWMMLLSLLAVASSLIFPSLLPAPSFPSAARIFAQHSFEPCRPAWMSLKGRPLGSSLMLPPERKTLV